MPGHGTFMWNELVTTDPDACAKFFAEVVGWDTDAMPMPAGGSESAGDTYYIWKQGDEQAGGMFKMVGDQWQGVPPHWSSYVHVDDVDAAAGKVPGAGGTVLVPPTDIPNIGRFCVVQDPTGATVSLMTPAQHE